MPELPSSSLEQPASAADTPAREGLFRLSAVHFLIALVLMIVAMSFVEQFEDGRLIEAMLITVVLLSAVPAVGGRRKTLLLAAALVTPAVIGTWLDHLEVNPAPKEYTLATAILFSLFIVVNLLGFILWSPRVNAEVLCAGISTYLMLGILWAFAYILVARLNPQAFAFTATADAGRPMSGFPALYFSFTTLTTVGYGDIIPVANVARLLAMLESTSGTFCVTILIARLVALYSSRQSDAGRTAAESSSASEGPKIVSEGPH